jgi:hypothetical protein
MNPEDLYELKFIGWSLLAYNTTGATSAFFWGVAVVNGVLSAIYIIRGMKK